MLLELDILLKKIRIMYLVLRYIVLELLYHNIELNPLTDKD